MKIGIFQYRTKWLDKKHNKNRILKIIETQDISYIDWIIFPEMTLSGYTNNLKYSVLTKEDKQFFVDISKKYHINVSYGGVENRFNKFITLNRNGERISEYSKIHLFTLAKEDKYYRRGKKSVVFDMEGFKVMPAVCFDLRFPKLFWDNALKSNLYVVIAAWPDKRILQWQTLLKARAIENMAYIIGVNSMGEDENGNEYKGYSFSFNPYGEMIIDCQSREGISVIDITPDDVERMRKQFPVLEAR